MAKRRRDLGDEEKALWGKVTETVTPMETVLKRRRRRKPTPDEGLSEPPHDDPPVSAPILHPAAPPRPEHRGDERHQEAPKPKKPALKPLVPIDPRTRRKIQRGSLAVEARIDLHGLTQAEAFSVLRSFLARTQMAGGRIVIVITGKGVTGRGRAGAAGLGSDLVFDPNERGILRRVVPQWLSLPDFRSLVAGYEEAGPAHGGAGALYVRLRKPRGVTLDP